MRLSTRRLAALLVCTLLLAVPAAGAKDFQAVTGSYTTQPYALYSVVQHSTNVCKLEFGVYFNLAGGLSGTVDLTVSMNLKGTCGDQAAPANLHGKGSFTGTLGERGGTFEGTFVGFHEQGQAHGRIIIQRGTGDLAGLHGILNLAGTVAVGGVYSGELHFAP